MLNRCSGSRRPLPDGSSRDGATTERRRARVRVLTGFGAFGLFWGTWGAALPAVQTHADVDDTGLGIALLMIGFGALVTMRATGALLDRFARIVVVLATCGFGVAGFLPALAHGVPALSCATFAVGLAAGAMDVGINAVAVDHEFAHDRRVLNSSHAAFSICVVVSGLGVAGLRSLHVSLWVVLLCSQALIVGLALVVMPSRAPWHPAPSGGTSPTRRRVPAVLVLLGALGAAAYLLENAWQSWSAILVHQDRGASGAISALAPVMFAAMAASGRLLGDPLAHRLPARYLLGGGAAIAAGGSWLAAQATDALVTFVGIAVAGLGTSVCAPTVIGLAGRAHSGLQRASAVSTVTTLSYLGFLIGPPLVGSIAGHTSLPSALTVVGVLAAVLAIAAVTVRGIPTRTPSAPSRKAHI